MSYIEETRAYVANILINCRTALIPYINYGSRNMNLLTSGIWIDQIEAPSHCIKAMYTATLHQILPYPLQEEPCLMARWKWISASCDNVDMSDFFASLRVDKNIALTDKEAIGLFIYQTGKIPDGPITVIFRDGTEGVIENV